MLVMSKRNINMYDFLHIMYMHARKSKYMYIHVSLGIFIINIFEAAS